MMQSFTLYSITCLGVYCMGHLLMKCVLYFLRQDKELTCHHIYPNYPHNTPCMVQHQEYTSKGQDTNQEEALHAFSFILV